MARIIKLIEVKTEIRGTGEPNNPIRKLYQLFTEDGDLVLEYDPHEKLAFVEPPHLKKDVEID